MPILSREQLTALLSQPVAKAKVDVWIGPLNAAMDEWSINTPQRQAAFLAQILHESNEFQHLVENLNYSADRLRQMWPSRFPTDAIAQQYAANPEKLANQIYAGRMGNGDEASGDGWRYRGRGLIQLTGRSNYEACSDALGVDFTRAPDGLSQPAAAMLSAAWFWSSRGLNALADHQPGRNDTDDFAQITRVINGGTAELDQRIVYWDEAKTMLGAMA